MQPVPAGNVLRMQAGEINCEYIHTDLPKLSSSERKHVINHLKFTFSVKHELAAAGNGRFNPPVANGASENRGAS